jgi:hypothetical protein
VLTKEITIEGQSFVLGKVKAGAAKLIQQREKAGGVDFSGEWLVASLQAGGDMNATLESVNELPYMDVYLPLQTAALEFNGLVKPVGEATAAPETAAASTSDTSTAQ